MKNILRMTVGAATLIGASTLILPENSPAYSLLGHNLGLTQRDFRLHDEFEAADHTNFTADDNWPGYTDVFLAVWKGGQEWGHTSFGDGSGDPRQGNVGDGGANFNPLWNGEASSDNGGNVNITGGIGGSSGGVLAFMQGGGSGWSIFFYVNAWNWGDNPNNSNGHFDIQGVMAHEYGHGLGLGHSGFSSATMAPSIASGSTGERSLHSDDQDGVQAIYGTLDTNIIPYVDNVTGSFTSGGTVVVTGRNFTFTANRVWMNSDILDGGNNGGDPFEISGLDSTNNQTQISFTLPASGYETGGLHIRKGGSGHDRMSNGWPIEFEGPCGGSDTITLGGNTSASPGDSVTYSWSGAPTTGTWNLLYSLTNSGSGCLEIGPNTVLAASGNNGGFGTGSFTGNVPNGAPTGITVYIEVQAFDNGGAEFDSNVVELDIN